MNRDQSEEILDKRDKKEDDNIYEAQIVEHTTDPAPGGTSWLPPVRPFWMDMLIIIGVYLGATIAFGLIAGLLAGLTKADPLASTGVAQILIYALVIPFSVWLLRKRGMKGPILSFSFKKADPLLILWGFVLIFVLGVVLEPLLELFPASYMDNMNQMIQDGGGWGMFMVVLLAPICEEMLFRGVIQGGASREYGPMRSILIASAVFAVVHLVPQQIINAFFCGIILGYVFYRTGSLIPVMLIHALNNAIAYIGVRMFPDSAYMSTRQLINSDVWYWIIYAVCAVIFVLALINLWKQLNKADKKWESAAK